MQIKQNILEIIEQGRTEGTLFYLPDGQLDRKTYLEVNKVLTALGGKWKRKLKAHNFKTDISEAIDDVLLTGEVINKKKEFQQFETPPNIVEQLIDLADLNQFGLTCLEPSAGRGNIAEALLSKGHIVFCVELDPENVKVLVEKGFPTNGHDFLHYAYKGPKPKYDRVVMNPPFTRQQDIDHVLEALTYLKEDGILVSVMSKGVTFRQDNKTLAFWKRVLKYDIAEIIDLPNGSFSISGTNAHTIILKIGTK